MSDDTASPQAPPKRWDLLAAAVRERRADLGMTQTEVAARGGPSAMTLRNIEAGKGVPLRPFDEYVQVHPEALDAAHAAMAAREAYHLAWHGDDHGGKCNCITWESMS